MPGQHAKYARGRFPQNFSIPIFSAIHKGGQGKPGKPPDFQWSMIATIRIATRYPYLIWSWPGLPYPDSCGVSLIFYTRK